MVEGIGREAPPDYVQESHRVRARHQARAEAVHRAERDARKSVETAYAARPRPEPPPPSPNPAPGDMGSHIDLIA